MLSSCKEHRNLELARQCYEEAMRLDPLDPSAYLLMAGIQAHDGSLGRYGIHVVREELDDSCNSILPNLDSSCTYQSFEILVNDKQYLISRDCGLH